MIDKGCLKKQFLWVLNYMLQAGKSNGKFVLTTQGTSRFVTLCAKKLIFNVRMAINLVNHLFNLVEILSWHNLFYTFLNRLNFYWNGMLVPLFWCFMLKKGKICPYLNEVCFLNALLLCLFVCALRKHFRVVWLKETMSPENTCR